MLSNKSESLDAITMETIAVGAFVLGALTLLAGFLVVMAGFLPANRITQRGVAVCLACLAIGFPFVLRVNEAASRAAYLLSVAALLCAAPFWWGKRARWTIWAAALLVVAAIGFAAVAK
jgi:hypothetical protein